MAVISVKEVSLHFGGEALFEKIDFFLDEGEKVCLLGRNGAGKSSFLRLLAGRILADSGEVSRNRQIRIALLDQDFATEFSGTCLEFCVASSATDDFTIDQVSAKRFLSKLGIEPGLPFASQSGGSKRRVMLARVLASGAEVLLLDEPTNHLDIDAILWLEDYLRREVRTLVLITHDRAFAKSVANRVAEIDRGQLCAFACGYERFLERRQALLSSESRARAEFDKKLAIEEAWLRRGVKARRTRDEGRVKALLAMREQHRSRRQLQGRVAIGTEAAQRSGDLVFEINNLSFDWPGASNQDAPLIADFSSSIMRGDRVGVVGPNGSGKTTLIKLLMDQLQPSSGSIRRGTNLKPIYYDQMRQVLDPDKTVLENLSDGDDHIVVGGRSRHVHAYLQDFLFSADRVRSPVSILSGGERNRLVLAKLFTQPSNLLVLDEPTNDLDMETLDVLEEMLEEYQGTILLVSHDREFLDNVVSNCLVCSGQGVVEEFVGGYSDWRQRQVATLATGTNESTKKNRPLQRKDKMSYKERAELAALPERIASLEAAISQLHATLADPASHRQGGQYVADLSTSLSESEKALEAAYQRWEELELRDDQSS